ncbi:MAG: hypothetical protein ABIJ25_08485, partial [Pseudomonadota bacterium]
TDSSSKVPTGYLSSRVRLRMVRTLNTYAEPGASPDADKLLSFRRYPGGAGELRIIRGNDNIP